MSEVSTIFSRLRNVEESIKEQPLKTLAVAAVTGLVVGGGYRSRLGLSLLGLVGRTVLHNVASSALSGAINKVRSDRDPEHTSPRKNGVGDWLRLNKRSHHPELGSGGLRSRGLGTRQSGKNICNLDKLLVGMCKSKLAMN
jgi:hypothetical protein